jgi:glycerophosphoryl diester phosphodiesterase
MKYSRILQDPLLKGGGRRLLELWKPLLLWYAVSGLLFFLFLSPFMSWILRRELLRGDAPVVANLDLISWGLSGRGFLNLSLLIGAALMTSVVRFSGIFLLLQAQTNGQTVRIPFILRRTLRLLPRLFKLCVILALAGMIWALLLGAGIFAIYQSLLSEFDINFYLSQRPREFQIALAALTGWLLVCMLPSLWLLGRLLTVLPAILTGDYRLLPAIRQAWRLPKKRALRLLRLMGTLLFGFWIFRLLANSLALTLARFILNTALDRIPSVRAVLVIAGAMISLNTLFAFLTGFAVFTLASILLIRFYFEETSLHHEATGEPVLPVLTRGLRHLLIRSLRPIVLFPLLIAFALFSLGISALALSRLPDMKTVYISAHRAGPPPAPENTLAALDAAIASGAEFTEIDVQLTADGRVVVVHDADLMRVANSPLVVTRTPFEQMRDLVQTPDDGSPADRRRIATLEDFLDEADGKIRLMIELKYYGFDPRLAEAVMEILDRHPSRDRSVLMSLDLPAVRQLQELVPDLPVGYLLTAGVGELRQMPGDFLAVNRQLATPAFLRRAARQGREVHVWTVNQKQDMIDLIVLGVDGLITDDPALAVQVRDELLAMTPVERLLLRWIVLALPENEPETDRDAD